MSTSRWPYRYTVLVLCTLAFFTTMVARLSISPVVPAISEDFGVSKTVIGLALTGMWLAYSLTQFPSGVLADRFGERKIILVAIGGTAFGSLALSLAPLFAIFLLCTVSLGALAGLHYSVATTLLTRTYEDIGTAIGLHNGGAPVAGLVTPVAAAWLASRYGWRPAVALAGLVGIPAFVAFARRIQSTAPRRPEQPLRERFQIGPIANVLSRPRIGFTVTVAVACTFIWQGVASFLPTFLVEYRGQSTTLAGLLFSVYFVVQGVVQIGVGALSDQYGRDVVWIGCMVAAAVGIGGLLALPGLTGAVSGAVLLGVGMSYGATMIPRFMDALGDAERGAGIGLVRTVYGVLGAFGSVGVGFLADVFTWAVSFGVLIAMAVLVLVVLLVNLVFGLEY